MTRVLVIDDDPSLRFTLEAVLSDAGLVVGHTLDAFRLKPREQYLGMIRLITVQPTKSVGKLVGKSTTPMQRGDNVTSKIGGGN